MVYGRRVAGRTLSWEASGALKDAALVLRDRETDSWWSLMTSEAIGGPLEGTGIPELPVGEKTTWGAWVARHPDTLVLSIDGVEHVESTPHDRYFTSERTFRGIEVEDDRLPAKEPIYAVERGGVSYAVPHRAIEGGRVFRVGDRWALLHRPEGSSVFASSAAWLLPEGEGRPDAEPEALLARLEAGELDRAEPLGGFDTYWYTWIAQHPGTELLE